MLIQFACPLSFRSVPFFAQKHFTLLDTYYQTHVHYILPKSTFCSWGEQLTGCNWSPHTMDGHPPLLLLAPTAWSTAEAQSTDKPGTRFIFYFCQDRVHRRHFGWLLSNQPASRHSFHVTRKQYMIMCGFQKA